MGDKDQKTMPIRLAVDAIEAAKLAATFQGRTVMDYASEILRSVANRDIEASIKARTTPQPAKGRAKKGEA
jgi:hypothetical protein